MRFKLNPLASSGISTDDITVVQGGGSSTTSSGGAVTSVNTRTGDVVITETDVLPTQTGNSGKYLTTNGTASSWATLAGGGDMSAATYDPATISEQLVGLTATQTLTNKTLSDSTTAIADNLDATKKIAFQASGITTATTRTITMPDADVDLANVPSSAEKTVLGNTSGTNTGDQDLSGKQDILAEGAFVDGDKTKLDGIETGADVTDTANVTSAGALMDSEVTNLAQVKAFNSADYATAAQGTTADSALQDITGEVLADLSDVTVTTPADNEVMAYDTTSGNWINQTTSEAGIASASHTHTASDVTDFDTEVSNNTDVAANTSARHAAVTVTDSAEIDFTLTGQDLTASIKAGSIDETKLDTSTNASLDLADSATQPGDLATVATTGAYSDLSGTPTVPTVDDTAYNATSWNTNTDAPTKNAVRDKIVSMDSAIATNTAKVSYTDAAKVATIETNADVTDTANVTAAGALMDSEVTNLAQVKAFDSSDYATAAQGALADTATQPGDLGDLATQDTVNNSDWSGTDLSVANGGTGASTHTSGNYLKGAGSSAITSVSASTLKSELSLVKGDVGLGNVDNTSDSTKNAASVTLTNKTIDGDDNTISNIDPSMRTGGFAIGSFTITGTGDKAITGVGFQPKLVEFYDGYSGGSGYYGHGVMDSSGNQWVKSIQTRTSHGEDSNVSTSRCIDFYNLSSGTQLQVRAVYDSMDSDGFTISVSDHAADRLILWKAYA